MKQVLVLAAAEAQLISLFNKLEDWREGLGERFDADFGIACAELERFPDIGPKYLGRFRRLLMRKWQVGVFYVVESDRIVLHGVLDLRQSPEGIRRQLGLI